MKLNEAQSRAVYSDSDRILVLAGAGTGKTHLMISRILRLVEEKDVDPESILALTFTNAAAHEMCERYISRRSNVGVVPKFNTFHSFCYSLLIEDEEIRRFLGYMEAPAIVEEEIIKHIQESVRNTFGIKLPISTLLSDKKLSLKDESMRKLFIKECESRIHKKGIITFDMLANHVCKLFINKSPLVDKYVSKYKYIFIDEFQDTDPLQWDFARCFESSNIFVVGDALQAIYGFRGATSHIIKELSRDFDWQIIKLSENYRSTQPIVKFANKHSRHASNDYRVELTSEREGDPVTILYDDISSMYATYSDSTLDSIAEFILSNTGKTAILVRSNSEVSDIRSDMIMKGVEISDPVSPHAVPILKSVLDEQYKLDYLLAQLNAEQYAEALKLEILNFTDEMTIDQKCVCIMNRFYGVPILTHIYESALVINEILEDEELLPFEKCTNILKALNISDINIEIMSFEKEQIIQYLIDEISKMQDSEVYIGTIHSSKGLEYDNVVLPGVGGFHFRLNDEESKNLYYVGITRAKNKLLVIDCD